MSPEGIDGYIEIENLKKVMTVNDKVNYEAEVVNYEVEFSAKLGNQSETQLWTLEEPDEKGWRYIRNVANGLYLTTNFDKVTELIVQEKGILLTIFIID